MIGIIFISPLARADAPSPRFCGYAPCWLRPGALLFGGSL